MKTDTLKTFTDVIKKHFKSDIIVAEIGVYLGENAQVLLRDIPNIRKLLLIDPYEPCEGWISDTVDEWAIEAAVGLGSLDEYHEILKRRRQNLLDMMEKFRRFSDYLVSIEEEADEEIGPHAFPIILKEGVGFTRDRLVDFLEKNGIETRSLFSSMPTQCPGFKFLGHKLGDFPNAEYIGDNGLHIGVHQDIDEEDIDYFISVVDRFLNIG